MCFHQPGWKTSWKISEAVEENSFHQLENEFRLARIRSVFKKWFPSISVTVLPNRKELWNKIDGFQQRENPFPKAGKKDSLKIRFCYKGKKLMVCNSQRIRFHYLEWSIRRKMRSHYTEKLLLLVKNWKWFPLAGKYFSVNKIDST